MNLESSAFFHNQNIPPRYTCDGSNINPPLTIMEPAPGSESLVLLMEDPDVPGSDPWVHWLAWDIDPLVAEIQEDSTPEGSTEGVTSFETTGYSGPCPSTGTHRYIFKLYALDTLLGLASDSAKDEVLSAMEGHVLDEAEPFIGLYSRENK